MPGGGTGNESVGGIGGGSKPNEGSEINADFFALGMTVRGESLQLRVREIIPIRIQIDSDGAVILEIVGYQMGKEIVGHRDGIRVVDILLDDTPTVPAEGHAVGPRETWHEIGVFSGIILHGHAPIGTEPDKHGGGRNGVAGDITMGIDVPR